MPISVAGPRSARGLAAALGRLVRGALELEGCTAGEIAVVLTGDAEVRALNRRWRGLDRATDVLSFGYDGQDGAAGPRRGGRAVDPSEAAAQARRARAAQRQRRRVRPVDGDIVISMDRTVDQAQRFRVTPGRELARLVIHGTLHLAGLDHDAPAPRRHMRAREERALRASRVVIAELDRGLGRAQPPASNERR